MESAPTCLAAWTDNIIAGGTVAAALIAAIGLFLTRRAIIQQSKSVDVQAGFDIFFAIRQSERDLHDMGDSESTKNFRLVEHFNFLELLAQLHNSKSLTKQADTICRDSLLNHLTALQLNEWARESLQRAVTSSETFEDLTTFCRKYKARLERRRDEILRSQRLP